MVEPVGGGPDEQVAVSRADALFVDAREIARVLDPSIASESERLHSGVRPETSDPGSSSECRDGSVGTDPAGAGDPGPGGFVFKYQSGSGAVGGLGLRRAIFRSHRPQTITALNNTNPAITMATHIPSARTF